MAKLGTPWFRNQAPGFELRTTQIVAEYAFGAGGRICDLPPAYLDAIAEAVVRRHPKNLDVKVAVLLVNGHWRRSLHPELRDQTLASLYRKRYDDAVRYYLARVRTKNVQHRNPDYQTRVV